MLLAAEIREGAIERIASGGTVLGPEVVAQLLARRHDPPGSLTPREREVVTHLADCCMNAAIETAILRSAGAVAGHVTAIVRELGDDDSGNDHRQVLAGLTCSQH
jgi:DNA-binding NarL/FixJ family response regulator